MTPLHSSLSGRGELLGAYHSRQPLPLRKAISTEGLPTSAEPGNLFVTGLPEWPYLTVLQNGIKAPRDEVAMTREVDEECPGGTWCDCQHQPPERHAGASGSEPPLSWLRQG